MSAKQVADELNISRTTLQRLIVEGKIKPIETDNPLLKRPRRLTFRRSDVEALLKPKE